MLHVNVGRELSFVFVSSPALSPALSLARYYGRLSGSAPLQASQGRSTPCRASPQICGRRRSFASQNVCRRQFSTTFVKHEDRRRSPEASPAEEDFAAPLPSQTEGLRWQLSKRTSSAMDAILARASSAGRHINLYTGTDYSGIETLRDQIRTQEDTVRDRHQIMDGSRNDHRNAHTQQAAAQKEIVGLLERKSSWSPSDLERYMSLVRSEHALEQAVQTAKDNLATAERNLEDARGQLERLERKQYHEEQIWSDTIRRNSTWVTFGLMGVNILLLLAQIVIFEPHRRKKIVREVQAVLNEKNSTSPPAPAFENAQSDGIATPSDTAIKATAPTFQSADVPPSEMQRMPTVVDLSVAHASSAPSELPPPAFEGGASASRSWMAPLETSLASLRDLFSERLIQVKMRDVTTTALLGGVTGMTIAALGMAVCRPR